MQKLIGSVSYKILTITATLAVLHELHLQNSELVACKLCQTSEKQFQNQTLSSPIGSRHNREQDNFETHFRVHSSWFLTLIFRSPFFFTWILCTSSIVSPSFVQVMIGFGAPKVRHFRETSCFWAAFFTDSGPWMKLGGSADNKGIIINKREHEGIRMNRKSPF